MPAGLDGHPEPIISRQRKEVLASVVDAICGIDKPRPLIAVDGGSAAGKSTFADELAARLAVRRTVVRSTTDSFHRPRSERYRRGPTSPEGYYLDSHDLDTVRHQLLEPFAAGAATVLVSAFHEPTDTPALTWTLVEEDAVLVFDGLFLQRKELRDYWDLTIYLDADLRRRAFWDNYFHADLPEREPDRDKELARRRERARWPRYQAGWALYLKEVDPRSSADIVVRNDDFGHPDLITRP